MDRPELLARLRALVPSLAARAGEGERLRRLPDATVAELRESGVFRAVVPERYGGSGLAFPVVPEIGRILGRADVSTAWVTTFLVMHNWLLAQFPDDVCRTVFEQDGYALAPAALSPAGRAEPRPGGFEVSGRWSWGSGVMHANWMLVSAIVAGDVPDVRMVLLAPHEVTVEDVWHTAGMRGTGSNDIVVDGVFVPHARTVSFLALVEGDAAAASGHEDPLLRLPLIPALAYTAAAPLVGGGEGALLAFADHLSRRVLANSAGERQRDQPAAQMHLAVADAEVRAASLLLDDGVERITSVYAAGGAIPRAERSEFRMTAACAVDLSKRAVRRLTDAAGGSAHFLDHPLQRFQRDLSTAGNHVVFDLDRAAETRGRILAGLEPGLTDML